MKVIVVGGDRSTCFIAQQLVTQGVELTLITPQEAAARWLSEQTTALVLLGDGSQPLVLEEAGVRQAEVVAALTPRDQDNLIICQLARQIYGVTRTLALVHDPANEPVFRQLGVSQTISIPALVTALINPP